MVVLCFAKGDTAYVIPHLWQKGVCFIFQINVQISGTPVSGNNIIYVSNHLSYLDIPALGSILKASFVAKREVASWPVFGFLSKLQQTGFIDRRGHTAQTAKDDLQKMLQKGKNLILFPEGTSSDGRSILPFKASLFELALHNKMNITVQPVKIEIVLEKDTQKARDLYAWYGDMELPPHLWAFARSGGAMLHITFFDPVSGRNRKDIAQKSYQALMQ